MKKTTFKSAISLATLVAVTLAGATLAYAKTQNQRAERMFTEMDSNGDGKITQAEITASKTRNFHAMDTNNDGAVSSDEMLNHAINKMKERMQERMGKRFAKIDKDSNGTISADEFGGRTSKMMEHLDTNKDGAISMQEVKDKKKKHQE